MIALPVFDGPLAGGTLEANPTAVLRTLVVSKHDGGPWPFPESTSRSTLVEIASYRRETIDGRAGWSCYAWNGPVVLRLLAERGLDVDLGLEQRVATVALPSPPRRRLDPEVGIA